MLNSSGRAPGRACGWPCTSSMAGGSEALTSGARRPPASVLHGCVYGCCTGLVVHGGCKCMRPPSRPCLFASRRSAGVMGRLVCSGRTAGSGRTGRGSRVQARVLFAKLPRVGELDGGVNSAVCGAFWCVLMASRSGGGPVGPITSLEVKLKRSPASCEQPGTKRTPQDYAA